MEAPLPSADVQKILLVDDEPAILRMFEMALRKSGFRVDAVESGTSARALLSLNHYDALLTDKNLPDFDGVALAQLARAAQPNLPIVMTTGYATPALAESLLHVVDVLFSKPVSLKTLVDGVKNVIARRSRDSGAVRAPSGEPPVVIVTPEPKLAYRVARVLKELGRPTEAVSGLEELSRIHALSGLVLDSRCVGPDGQRSVWRMLGRHEHLKVLVLGGDGVRAVSLGAALQLAEDADDKTLRAGVQRVFLTGPARTTVALAV